MTQDEARRLKPGARLYTMVGAGMDTPLSAHSTKVQLRLVEWVRPTATGYDGAIHWAAVRRVGFTRAGRRYPEIERRLTDLLTPAAYQKLTGVVEPNLTPNVYADFLEERGHTAAAAALRRAFPMTQEGEQ